MGQGTTLIIHNIISPYKTKLFNNLNQLLDNDLKVLYMAETENIREWRVATEEIEFDYDIMFTGSINDVSALQLARKTVHKLRIIDPEVVIIGGWDRVACWVALAWAQKRKKMAIVMVESHLLDKKRSKLKEIVKKIFVSRCDAVLAAGSRHRDYVIMLGARADRVFITKGVGGVDSSLYQSALELKNSKAVVCEKMGIPPLNYFIYVGRFAPEKNLLLLLEVYSKLLNKGMQGWGLVLVGSGPLEAELKSFINENNLDNVFLPGFMQKEKLIHYYAAADIFVLPSISETWGLVVDEAMSMGLPIIVSKVCGCYPDIVQDNVNGFSFSPENGEELFSIMNEIVEGKYDLKTMGSNSLAIISDYGSDKAAEVWARAVNVVRGDYQ